MHSTIVRAQNVFGFFTTVAFAVAALIAASVIFSPQTPRATLELRNVQVVRGRPSYYSSKREEYAHIKFDLDMDLSSLYNWNTKQVFVYVKATWPGATPSSPRSEAIVWDGIFAAPSAPWHQNYYTHPSWKKSRPAASKKQLQDTKARTDHVPPRPGVLALAGQRPKYQITDATGKVAARDNATLELGWNVQPWVGALLWANTRRDYGLLRWRRLRGGRAEAFTFPQAKVKEGKAPDLGTVKGGEGNRGRPA